MLTRSKWVVEVWVYLDYRYRTAEDIGVDSSAVDVEKTYGVPQRKINTEAGVGTQTVPVLHTEYDIGLFVGIFGRVVYVGVNQAKNQ